MLNKMDIHFTIPVKELRDNGVEIIVPIAKGVSVKQFAFIRDSNGFPIELVEE